MNRKYYLAKGFTDYAIMSKSDKYTQGIEIWYPSMPIKSENQPAVYILTNKEGIVLKIGETQNLTSRFRKGYRCITNITNNRIREHIRTVEDIYVYVYMLPIEKKKILGYKCETSYVKGLEYNLLKEYKDKTGVVPSLNVFIK